MNKTETKDTKAIEKDFLLNIWEFLERAEEAIKYKDFAVAQGALRAAYNGVGKLIYDSEYLSDIRRKLLEKFNNNIFRIRENIVGGLETDNLNLAEVISSHNIRERVGSAKVALNRYINYWYGQS